MNGEDMSIDTWPDYPFAPHWLEIGTERMHYVDEGHGDPVLLLHGEPTSSFLWRKIIPQLPGRVVAPDLIGFGRSDKPEDIGWYSYDRHVDSIARLVEELDLTALTLVVHDWGGPIGLRVAVEHAERVDRLVLLNTGIGGGSAPSERGSGSARSCASSAARSTSAGSSKPAPRRGSTTTSARPTTPRFRRRSRRPARSRFRRWCRRSPSTRTRRR